MQTHSLARGLACLGLAVAPLIVSEAYAAPAGHRKASHVAPARTDSAPPPATLGDTAHSAAQPSDDAPGKPSDDAPAKPAETAAFDAAPPGGAEPAPSPAPEAVPSPASDRSDAASDRSDAALAQREAARLAAGRIEVGIWGGLDVATRHFRYSDPVGHLLAPYSLPAVPMVNVGLEAYPWVSTGLPVLRDLGFRGHLSRAFGGDSKTPEGIAINTSWTRFGGELRERLLVPGAHHLEAGFSIGGDANYFDMSAKSKVAAYPPRARTIAVSFGLDGRVLLAGQLSALLGVAFLHAVEDGEIYDRFRDPSLNGLDANLGFALGLLPGLEARLTGRYTRYFSTFKPQLGDQAVAGGALDQLLQIGLGVRYAH